MLSRLPWVRLTGTVHLTGIICIELCIELQHPVKIKSTSSRNMSGPNVGQMSTKQRKPNGEMNDLGTKNCGGSESYTGVPSPIPISQGCPP
ncbi:hypothetical protein EMCRGX_G002998 [Ephydatia muelleri]